MRPREDAGPAAGVRAGPGGGNGVGEVVAGPATGPAAVPEAGPTTRPGAGRAAGRGGRAAGRAWRPPWPLPVRLLLGTVVPLTLVALWQVVGGLGPLGEYVPAPVDVGRAFVRFFDPSATGSALPGTVSFAGQAWVHIGASTWLLLSSYLLALVIGVPAGAALALSPVFRALTDPMVQGLRAIPIFAWLPLAIVWFGLGAGSSRFLVVIGAVFPVLVATADAVARVPRGYVESAQMLGTRRRALLRRVYLPAALPGIVVGCRLGVSLGWMSVIVGEFTGADRGVGAMMQIARQTGRLDEIVVGMVCFALLGLASDTVLRLASARWTRWARQ